MGVFLPFTFDSVRMVAWWLLIAAPILSAQIASNMPWSNPPLESEHKPTRGAAILWGGVLLVMVASLPWLERVNPFMMLPERTHRQEADLQSLADHVAVEKPDARIFTRFAWGEYFGWSLGSRGKVFMDGRIEIIPDEVWSEYVHITRGRPEWEGILDRYDVDYLILDRSGYHEGLLPLVNCSSKWHVVAEKGNAVLFSRDPKRSVGAGQRSLSRCD